MSKEYNECTDPLWARIAHTLKSLIWVVRDTATKSRGILGTEGKYAIVTPRKEQPMQGTDLNLMNIDEAIAHTEERAKECYKNGFKCLGSYYGGYYEALKDIKNGNIKLEADNEQRAD